MRNIVKRILILLCITFLLCSCKKTKKEEYDIAGNTYYNTVNEYELEEPSNAWFGKDGSFVMKENHFDGYYEFEGKWNIKENVITIDIESSLIANLGKIIFEIEDEDTIILKTMLVSSRNENVFSSNKPQQNTNTITQKDSKTYYNVSNNKSYLVLNDDRTFKMVENNGTVTLEIEGLYAKEGNTYIFSDFDHFKNRLNEDIYNFEFHIYDEDTIVSRLDLFGSNSKDVFSISGKLPDGYNSSDVNKAVIRFVHEPTDMTSEMYLPYIEFDNNGKFVFIENLFSGMGEISGTYELSGNVYTCRVEKIYSGFINDDVRTIVFEYKDSSTIVLKTDLCMSLAGDLFYIQ